jgi:hypothetical protein
MFRTLVKTGKVEVDGQQIPIRYFELRTERGLLRFSAEILLGPGDRIILDDDSVTKLEARAGRLIPATVYSHVMARTA